MLMLAMASALAACAPPTLSDSSDIPAMDNRDYLLHPGDVVHLTVWVAGVKLQPGHASNNTYPPILLSERIPLRKVGGRSTLRPLEVAFLGAVLSTNLNAPPAGDQIGTLKSGLNTYQRELWNALIMSLIYRGAPKHLFLRERAFCENLKALAPNAPDLLFTTYLEPAFYDSTNHTCVEAQGPSPDKHLEVFDLSPVIDGLDPIVSTDSNAKSGKYYSNGNLVVVSTAVEVEQADVSMRDRSGMQALWTLAEWEESEVCGRREIDFVRIGVHDARWLRVVPQSQAELDLKFHLDAGSTGEVNHVGRKLDNVNTGAHKQLSLFGPHTISRESLSYLYPGDLSGVQWGDSNDELGPTQQQLCTLD
jgi:hypothetical protein